MFIAAEPVTQTVDGAVLTTPAGQPVPNWEQFPYRVRLALTERGSVFEAPDLAPDPLPSAAEDGDTRPVPVDAALPYACPECPGVSFESKRSLGQHIRWAHREQEA